MQQQVNLYQRTPAPSGVFALGRSVAIAAALVALILLYPAGRWLQLRHIESQVHSLDERREEAATVLEQDRRKEIGPQLQALKAEAMRLETERSRRQQVLDRIRQGGFGNLEGFSPLLTGFARHRVDGLWLDGIRLYQGGAQMTLRGYALSAPLVTDFLHALGEDKRFAGRSFGQVSLAEDAKAAALRFELRTESGSATP